MLLTGAVKRIVTLSSSGGHVLVASPLSFHAARGEIIMVIKHANLQEAGVRIWTRIWCIEKRSKELELRVMRTLSNTQDTVDRLEQRIQTQA